MPVLVGTRRQLLQGRDQAILFEDNFDGSSLSSMKWTLTDTESKISVSGGNLVSAGGLAVPAWNNPRAVGLGLARLNGLTIDFYIKTGVATENAVGFTKSLPGGLTTMVGIAASASNNRLYAELYDGESREISLPIAYVASTDIYLRVVLQSAGALLYYGTNKLQRNIAWVTIAGSTATLYPIYTEYSGLFYSSHVKAYRSYVPTPVVNISQAITPSLGSELLTNGNMETGDPPSSWNADGATLSSVADERTGGAGTKSLNAAYAANGQHAYQSLTQAAGMWCQINMWAKKASGTLNDVQLHVRQSYNAGTFSLNSLLTPGASWANIVRICRLATTNPDVTIRSPDGATNENFRFDDVSVKPLTLSSLVGTLQVARKEGIFERAITVASGYQAGFWLNWDGNTDGTEDYVEALVDLVSNTARLSKCVNGTITNNVITGAITYSAGATLRVVRVGTSYCLYYNNLIVGSAATISDAGITNNTGFTSFSTDPSASGAIVCYSGINVP